VRKKSPKSKPEHVREIPLEHQTQPALGRRYTRDEKLAHKALLSQILPRESSNRNVLRRMRERFPMMTMARVKKLTAELYDEWREFSLADVEKNRLDAIQRHRTYITMAHGQRTPDGAGWLVPPNHAALIGHEKQLARLQGTEQPIKIDVEARVVNACVSVIAGMSHEEIQHALTHQQEMRRLAEAYKQEHPTVDGEGVTVG
jgi:hypothetical protein